jgi:RNA polymerase sigma-70 factor (ECF subfamily)
MEQDRDAASTATEPVHDDMSRLEEERPHLRRYALSLARDVDDAEDLVQDCLVRALDKADRFEEGTHLRRWLFTILRNLHIDRRRRRARRGVDVPLNDWEPAASRPPAQEDHIELNDVLARFESLRECDQEVLRLSVFEGLPHDAIAERMDVAVGTVKSRLSRARDALAS